MASSPPADRVSVYLPELSAAAVYEADGRSRRILYRPGDNAVRGHIEADLPRLNEFLDLLPEPTGSLRVLDLGANPYILTYALVRMGARVVASGHPAPGQPPAAGEEWVEFDGPAIRCRVPLYRFNVELDRFPFADASFDVVVCGELIEHLPNGPDRLLYECNRVLVDGGRLLLSTPNAVSVARLMAIARGVNPDWPFSPQGLYARHNRLYTFGELRDLLEGTGFRPFREKGLSFRHQRSWYKLSPSGWAKWAVMAGIHGALARQPYRLRRFAEGILVAALKVGPPRTYRPDWLFGSADSVPMVAERAGRQRPLRLWPRPAAIARASWRWWRFSLGTTIRKAHDLRRRLGLEPVRTAIYLGKPFSYHADSLIGAYIARGGEWDALLRPVLTTFLPREDPFVCEVGSNIGASLLQMLAVKPHARVLAFEPSDRFRPLLQRNLEFSGGAGVEIVACALGARDGRVCLYNNATSASVVRREYDGHQPVGSQLTAMTTLDEVLGKRGRVDFIKVDTDGFDFEVLRGGERVLRTDQPLLFFELAVHLLSRPEADLAWLQGLGYRRLLCFSPTPRNAWMGATMDVDRAVGWARANVYCDVLAWPEGSLFEAQAGTFLASLTTEAAGGLERAEGRQRLG